MEKNNKTKINDYNKLEPWAQKLIKIIQEKDIKQKKLASGSKVSEATISEWVGVNKKSKTKIEPKIMKFKAVADYLGVSVDYLLGANECKTPKNEEIHKLIGISDEAIDKLKQLQNNIKYENDSSEKSKMKMIICNYLIENIENSSLFENLYHYFFDQFLLKSNGKLLKGGFLVSKLPSGKKTNTLIFTEVISDAFLSKIQSDIIKMKVEIEKIKKERRKVKWIQTDDYKEICSILNLEQNEEGEKE